MKSIYHVKGTLNKGFVGQISYTICLDQEYKEMDICFTFHKQHYDTITDELITEYVEACNGEYPSEVDSQEKIINSLKGAKTEIHPIVTMNDIFIGGVHQQLTTRHLTFAPGYASEGCIVQEQISGMIKVTLVVFNVIMDDTDYSVTLSVNE